MPEELPEGWQPDWPTPEEVRAIYEGKPLREGFVYFLAAGPFVKIGWAKNPHKRIERFRVACPYRVRLVATHPAPQWMERDYHLRFALHRWRNDGEWFVLDGELLLYVAHLVKGGRPMWDDPEGRRERGECEIDWKPKSEGDSRG